MFKHSVLCALVFFTGSSFSADEFEERIPAKRTKSAARRILSEEIPDGSSTAGTEGEGITLKTSSVLMKDSEWTPTWRPHMQKRAIGIETASGSFGALGTNAISYTKWGSPSRGMEYLFGYFKNEDSYQEKLTKTQNNVGSSTQGLEEITEYSGSRNPHNFIFGMAYREKLHQSDWMQIYWGLLGAVQYSTSASYKTGTLTKTTSNISNPNTYSLAENVNYGETTRDSRLQFFVGPKLGSEFYLRWFPQLALGFSTGVLANFGTASQETAITNVGTETTSVTNGTVTTAPINQEKSVTTTNPGDLNGQTLAIGGQTFSFTGQFTIRYIW